MFIIRNYARRNISTLDHLLIVCPQYVFANLIFDLGQSPFQLFIRPYFQQQKVPGQQDDNQLGDTSCQQEQGGAAHDNYAGNHAQQYQSEYQEKENPGSDKDGEFEVERNPGRILNKSPQPDLIPCRTGSSEEIQGLYNISCLCRANIHYTIHCGQCHSNYNSQDSFDCQV